MKFIGQPLEIPAAVTGTQAVRKQVVDALDTRVAALESSGGGGGSGTSSTLLTTLQSGAYTASARDYVLANASAGGFTVTLPSAPATNTVVAVKKVDVTTNLVTVVGSNSTTIDGDPSAILGASQAGAEFIFDGTNWRVSSTVVFDAPIGVTYRGTYSAGSTYNPNDVVTYNSGSYVNLVASTGTAPGSNVSTSTWGLIAAAGQLYTTFQGAYAGATAYVTGQIVTFSGGTYMALASTTGTAPTAGSSTATWAMLSAQGVQYRGVWSSATAYVVNDLATYRGETYIALVASTNQTPNVHTTSTYWQPFAMGLYYRGTYSGANTYYLGDVVYYNGSSYGVVFPNAFSGQLPTNTSYWNLIAAAASFTTTYKGTWSGSTTYLAGDIVTYNGSMYVAQLGGTTQFPLSTGTSYWSPAALGLYLRGAHSTGTTYYLNDVVVSGGSTWIYVNATPGQTTAPSQASSTNWTPMALGLKNQGTWASATTYYTNDVVLYQGTSYVAVAASLNANPQTTPASWLAMVTGFYDRGAWVASTTYYPGDVVLSGGSSYTWVGASASDGTTDPYKGNANWTRITGGYRYAGTWSAGTYYLNDVVYYLGNSYVCTTASNTNAPTTLTGWGYLALAGATPTTTIGTVTALAAGATPTVTNTGTAPNITFNFGLPAGLGFTFRNAYVAATAYAINDVVTYLGSTYVAVTATTGATPTTTMTTPWKVIAQGLKNTGTYSAGTTYYPGDYTFYQGSLWVYINAAASSGTAPTVLANTTWSPLTQGFNPRTWAASGVYYPGDLAFNGGAMWRWNGFSSGTDTTTPPYQGNPNWDRWTSGFNYRGAWTAGTYYTYDVVNYLGSTYQATATTTNTPNTLSSWALVSLGFNYRGAWAASITYYVGDLVYSGGTIWRWAVAAGTDSAVDPATGTNANWTRYSAGFNNRATWSAGTYYLNDVVQLNGSTYVCTTASTTNNPTTLTGWTLFAQAGTNGTNGTAATIAAGTASALAAGATPTVSNSGTSAAAVFNFGIPAGATGSPGTAATVAAGTATGLAAGASPTVSNSGSSSAAVFNFGIPAGATGTAATIAAGTASVLASGTAPTVTNSGTSSAAVFNFGIPAGPGLPAGGSTGQIIRKSGSGDYVTAWANDVAQYSNYAGLPTTGVLVGMRAFTTTEQMEWVYTYTTQAATASGTPYWVPAQAFPILGVYQASAQSIAPAGQVMVCDTFLTPTVVSCYSTTTGVFTAPWAGWYELSGSVTWSGVAASLRQAYWQKNNSAQLAAGTQGYPATASFNFAMPLRTYNVWLAPAGTANPYLTHGSGSNISTVAGGAYASGFNVTYLNSSNPQG